jgi:hypothetical protein
MERTFRRSRRPGRALPFDDESKFVVLLEYHESLIQAELARQRRDLNELATNESGVVNGLRSSLHELLTGSRQSIDG